MVCVDFPLRTVVFKRSYQIGAAVALDCFRRLVKHLNLPRQMAHNREIVPHHCGASRSIAYFTLALIAPDTAGRRRPDKGPGSPPAACAAWKITRSGSHETCVLARPPVGFGGPSQRPPTYMTALNG